MQCMATRWHLRHCDPNPTLRRLKPTSSITKPQTAVTATVLILSGTHGGIIEQAKRKMKKVYGYKGEPTKQWHHHTCDHYVAPVAHTLMKTADEDHCARFSKRGGHTARHLWSIKCWLSTYCSYRPFRHIWSLIIDFVDMSAKIVNGKRYILVLIDSFSRWVEAVAKTKNDARTGELPGS